MYRYTDFDRQFVHQRAAQFRELIGRARASSTPNAATTALEMPDAATD